MDVERRLAVEGLVGLGQAEVEVGLSRVSGHQRLQPSHRITRRGLHWYGPYRFGLYSMANMMSADIVIGGISPFSLAVQS